MLEPKEFLDLLKTHEIDFFTGVPDSLLKDFCACVAQKVPRSHHVSAANEGGAVGIAAGYQLATGRYPLVYLQNSGLGNTVNPLTSLTDPAVYSIPVLLLIGHRGEPGVADEPQHVKQGAITVEQLEVLGIPWWRLPADLKEAEVVLEKVVNQLYNNQPAALVVSKDTFAECKATKPSSDFELSREAALKELLVYIGEDDIVVSTTGKLSRELFELREGRNEGHAKDFLTVGSMGHASQIALGIALQKPKRTVWCLDGDGAALMHLGGMVTIGDRRPTNFKHVVFNNQAHESVGGQPTAGVTADLGAIAKASGYQSIKHIKTEKDFTTVLAGELPAPAFIEIAISCGARKDLGRPTTTPKENKSAFMEFIDKS